MTDLENFKELIDQMKHVYLTALQSEFVQIRSLGSLINKWYDILDVIYDNYKMFYDQDQDNTDCEEQLTNIKSDLDKMLSISRGFNV